MFGLMNENGPMRLQPGTQTLSENQYAWSGLVDYFWVDNPVCVSPVVMNAALLIKISCSGVGFSTVETDGYGESFLL